MSGFPWEEDTQRANRSKKYGRKQARYRKAKSIGPKVVELPKQEPGWYRDYLKSEHWLEFKVRYAASKQPKTCVVCGSKNYELHHRIYERLWQEYLTDVVPLCRKHHAQTHVLVKQGHDLLDAHKKVKI